MLEKSDSPPPYRLMRLLARLASTMLWLVASAWSGPSTQLSIDGTLVSGSTCDPTRPAFACSGGQSCQPASGGGHRCQ